MCEPPTNGAAEVCGFGRRAKRLDCCGDEAKKASVWLLGGSLRTQGRHHKPGIHFLLEVYRKEGEGGPCTGLDLGVRYPVSFVTCKLPGPDGWNECIVAEGNEILVRISRA